MNRDERVVCCTEMFLIVQYQPTFRQYAPITCFNQGTRLADVTKTFVFQNFLSLLITFEVYNVNDDSRIRPYVNDQESIV